MNEVEYLASQRCSVTEIALGLRMSVRKVRAILRPREPVVVAPDSPSAGEWLALLHRCWPLGAGGVGPPTI